MKSAALRKFRLELLAAVCGEKLQSIFINNFKCLIGVYWQLGGSICPAVRRKKIRKKDAIPLDWACACGSKSL
jgi:hypothetical protein